MKLIDKALGCMVLIALVLSMNGCTSSTSDSQNFAVNVESSTSVTETLQIEEEIAQTTLSEEQITQTVAQEETLQQSFEKETVSDSKEKSDKDGAMEEASEGLISGLDAADDTVSELSVHFIDVGQGDCTLVMCDGEAMLIDAGDKDKGTTVQLYLKKQGVSSLKYVIGTHPDADHIGGLNVILYKYDCETIIMPDMSSDSSGYQKLIDTIYNKNGQITPPVSGTEYMLGHAIVTILGPTKAYAEDNNNSVVVRITHGSNSFLITGDIEEEAETDLVQSGLTLASTVLKVSHHGSKNATGDSFLQQVNPEYAVISCGEGNAYGHPHAATLNKLRIAGCQVYRTDEQGSIVVTSNSESLTWNCSPSETWKAGEPAENKPEAVEPGTSEEQVTEDNSITETSKDTEVPTTQYILNTNTMKFHYPNCSSVKDIKEKNKKESTEDRDTLISQGYVPCKRCNP